MIKIANLTVNYEDTIAVQGVNLELASGQCLAIIGDSGSGKSTIAKAILGLLPLTAETSYDVFDFQGVDLTAETKQKRESVRGSKIALINQDALSALDPLKNAAYEIVEAARIHSIVEKKSETEFIGRLSESVGFEKELLPKYTWQISGGQRQRALVASALSADPDLIIADEPTASLDSTRKQQIIALLAAQKKLGKSIILITHDLEILETIADFVIELRPEVAAGKQQSYQDWKASRISRNVEAKRNTQETKKLLLEAIDVSVKFRGQKILEDVSLQIKSGDMLQIVGDSGVGKTTLARLLIGELLPDTGYVFSYPEKPKRRNSVQLIPQDVLGSFDPLWNVGQAISEGMRTHKSLKKAAVSGLLYEVGLETDLVNRKISQLSGGQRQRVAIARALAVEPDVLILDESLSGLDYENKLNILNLLRELAEKRGLASVIIGHDTETIAQFANRSIELTNSSWNFTINS